MSIIRSAVARCLRLEPLARFPPIFSKAERRVGVPATARHAPSQQHSSSTPFPSPAPQYSNITPLLSHTPPVLHARDSKPNNDFNELIASLTHVFTTTNSSTPTVPILHTLLKSYTSDMSHWSKYAHADPTKQYTRNLIFSVPNVFNLLLLVWNPRKQSPVHDHADAHCLMKILKGNIIEKRFATPEWPGEQGPLLQTSMKEYRTNQVAYMADALGLHMISNPHLTEPAVSLHLYTPPNAALRGCYVYDMENGERRHVMQNVYHSVCGKI